MRMVVCELTIRRFEIPISLVLGNMGMEHWPCGTKQEISTHQLSQVGWKVTQEHMVSI